MEELVLNGELKDFQNPVLLVCQPINGLLDMLLNLYYLSYVALACRLTPAFAVRQA